MNSTGISVKILYFYKMFQFFNHFISSKSNFSGYLFSYLKTFIYQWLRPVILATWEVKIERILVWGQPGI
jgi:hypothetical protein